MKIDQQVPMLLVGREALNDAIVGEKNVMSRPFFWFSFIELTQPLLPFLIFHRVSITCQKQGAYVFQKSKLSPVYDIRTI